MKQRETSPWCGERDRPGLGQGGEGDEEERGPASACCGRPGSGCEREGERRGVDGDDVRQQPPRRARLQSALSRGTPLVGSCRPRRGLSDARSLTRSKLPCPSLRLLCAAVQARVCGRSEQSPAPSGIGLRALALERAEGPVSSFADDGRAPSSPIMQPSGGHRAGSDGRSMTEYHSVKAFAREEPRIELIEAMLQSVLGARRARVRGRAGAGRRLPPAQSRGLAHRSARPRCSRTSARSRPPATAAAGSAMKTAIRPACSRRSRGSSVSRRRARARRTCTTAGGCRASPRASSSRSPTRTSSNCCGSIREQRSGSAHRRDDQRCAAHARRLIARARRAQARLRERVSDLRR